MIQDKVEHRLAVVMAMPRPTKRLRPDFDPDSEWIKEPEALEKWTIAMAFNQEALELQEKVTKLVKAAELPETHPVHSVQLPENNAGDRFRYVAEVLRLIKPFT